MKTAWNCLAGLCLLACATPAVAGTGAPPPSGPDQPQRVLLPSAAERLEAAFARAAPAWRLDGARIAKDRVDARACAGDACHDLVLTDGRTCSTAPVGAWCVAWSGARPAAADALDRALAADADADVWHVIAARPPQPDIVAAPPPEAMPAGGPATATMAGEHAPGPAAVTARPPPPGETGDDGMVRVLVIALLVGAAALLALNRLRGAGGGGDR